MAKTKLEKIESIEEQIRQLNAQKTKIKQQHNVQERKARNHRLCKRGGFVEKLLPDLITLTEEQFETFINKTLMTDHSKRILGEMAAQNTDTATQERTGTAAQGNAPTATNPAQTEREGGEDEDTDEQGGTRVSE